MATLADLEQLLDAKGLRLNEVKAVEIVSDRRGCRDSGLALQVTRYMPGPNDGKLVVRLPDGSADVVTERVMFPIDTLPEIR
jgi:urease gamma subunit